MQCIDLNDEKKLFEFKIELPIKNKKIEEEKLKADVFVILLPYCPYLVILSLYGASLS